MSAAFVPSRLEQILYDQFPLVVASLEFYTSSRGIVGNVTPDGRRLLARTLAQIGHILNHFVQHVKDSVVGPQLQIVMKLAQDCWDLSELTKRYASSSLGVLSVKLSASANTILTVYESHDPLTGLEILVSNLVRDGLLLIEGITIAF